MTDVTSNERDELKLRATQMGLEFPGNIPTDKLRELVNAAVEGKGTANTEAVASDASENTPTPTKKMSLEARRKDALALVRVRITCMNANKKEWNGELFTTGNRLTGTVKKFVPFDTEWHIPRIIYNMIKSRKCQVFYSTKDARGNSIRKGKMINEFAIEELPPLTKEELKDLAQRQAMANGTSA